MLVDNYYEITILKDTGLHFFIYGIVAYEEVFFCGVKVGYEIVVLGSSEMWLVVCFSLSWLLDL